MSTAGRVIKNTGFLYIKMGVTIVISLYSTRLVLAALGSSDYGIFAIIGSAIGMLSFLNYTMANATQRFMSYAEGEGILDNKIKVFNVSILLHVLIALFTAVVLLIGYYFFFSGLLNIPLDRIFAAKVIYFGFVISTIFTILNVPYDAVMNAHENMLYYSIVGILEALLKLGIAYICVLTNSDKLIMYGVLISCVPLFTLTIMKIYCHLKYEECKISIKKCADIKLIREIAFFSGWNFLTAISNLASGQGLSIVLNHFWGTTLNAAYGIAQQVNGQLSAFAENIKKALNPVIVKNAGANNVDSMNAISILGCKYTTLLTVFFAIPLIVEMPYVLGLWLKEVPDWTVVFCQLQLVHSIITQMTSGLATSIYANGNIKYYAIYKSITNILPFFFSYLCFSFGWGPIWLYIPMIVIWGVGGNIVIMYYSNKLCGLHLNSYVKSIFRVCFTTILVLISGCLVVNIMDSCFVRLIICSVMTSATLFMSIWTFNMNSEERLYLRSLFQRINKY